MHSLDHDSGTLTLRAQRRSTHPTHKALGVVLGLDTRDGEDVPLSQWLVASGAEIIGAVRLDKVHCLVAIFHTPPIGI